MHPEEKFRCCGGGDSPEEAFLIALPSEEPGAEDDGTRRELRRSLLKRVGVSVFYFNELPETVTASRISKELAVYEERAREAGRVRDLAEADLFSALTRQALCEDGREDLEVPRLSSLEETLRRRAEDAAQNPWSRASRPHDWRGQSVEEAELRFLQICSCVCEFCTANTCGVWLDALRVLGASDHELFFLQTAETRASQELLAARRRAHGCQSHFSLTPHEQKDKVEKDAQISRLRWGVFGTCAGGTSLRRCLRILQEQPLLIRVSENLEEKAEDSSVQQRKREFAEALLAHCAQLACDFAAPANMAQNECRLDHAGFKRLCRVAGLASCFVHPALCVADFAAEGRGIAAVDRIGCGELLLQIPLSEVVNVYTALSHPLFGRVAAVLLGGSTVSEVCSAAFKERKDRTQPGQPLVDGDAACCLFLLFLAYAMGTQGATSLLQFLPAASPSDAVSAAVAARKDRVAQRLAFDKAASQIPLLHGPPEAVEYAARVFPSVASTTERTHERAFSVYRQLMEILPPLFPLPSDWKVSELEGRGVLNACFRAAKAAASADIHACEVVAEAAGLGRGCVAAAASAIATSAEARRAASEKCGVPLDKPESLVGAFLRSVDFQDFLWAEQVLASRSFSVRPKPLSPLREVDPTEMVQLMRREANTRRKRDEAQGGRDVPLSASDREEESDEELLDEEDDVVPFLPELKERQGRHAFPQDGFKKENSSVDVSREAALVESPYSSAPVYVPRRCATFIAFAELLNHSPLAQVGPPTVETRLGADGKEKELVLSLRAITDIACGAQVYLHYGPLQSWEFATFFGFVPSQPLVPPHKLSALKSLAAAPEGNPDDVLTVQLDVDRDDPELDLKETVLRLQKLPEAVLFRTETVTEEEEIRRLAIHPKALAALWVYGHPSLGEFIAAASSALNAVRKKDFLAAEKAASTFSLKPTTAKSALAAALAGASETAGLWSERALKEAIRVDSNAAQQCRRIVEAALNSLAQKLDECRGELEAWLEKPQSAPFWVRRCGTVVLRLMKNQKELVNQQVRVLEAVFPTRSERLLVEA